MSRSGYSFELDNWDLIKWRGQVASAIRGKRGQKFLKDLLIALDAMPEKRLIEGYLQDEDGEVCAIGALARARGLDVNSIDPEEPEQVALAFNIARQLAAEVVFQNDEAYARCEQPKHRYLRMKDWVASLILP